MVQPVFYVSELNPSTFYLNIKTVNADIILIPIVKRDLWYNRIIRTEFNGDRFKFTSSIFAKCFDMFASRLTRRSQSVFTCHGVIFRVVHVLSAV